MPMEHAKGVHDYLVKTYKFRDEIELKKYHRQVVNGYNHVLTYQFKVRRVKIHVHEDIEGNFSDPKMVDDRRVD